jgi:hypothetical protein
MDQLYTTNLQQLHLGKPARHNHQGRRKISIMSLPNNIAEKRIGFLPLSSP